MFCLKNFPVVPAAWMVAEPLGPHYLLAWELLETGGVDLTAGRGEILQKVFCHYTQSLPNPFASMAPCCKG
jgi:hypothetical protein